MWQLRGVKIMYCVLYRRVGSVVFIQEVYVRRLWKVLEDRAELYCGIRHKFCTVGQTGADFN